MVFKSLGAGFPASVPGCVSGLMSPKGRNGKKIKKGEAAVESGPVITMTIKKENNNLTFGNTSIKVSKKNVAVKTARKEFDFNFEEIKAVDFNGLNFINDEGWLIVYAPYENDSYIKIELSPDGGITLYKGRGGDFEKSIASFGDNDFQIELKEA